METTKRDAKVAAAMAEVERFARIYARWSRNEATDRQYANARARIEKAVTAAVKR